MISNRADHQFITVKENKRYDFGDALYSCRCPNSKCTYLLTWRQTASTGIWWAECCGKRYEMYTETVTFTNAGAARAKVSLDTPRRRRVGFKVLIGSEHADRYNPRLKNRKPGRRVEGEEEDFG